MGIMDGAGVQMMLQNLIKAAAPELVATVEQMRDTLVAFKRQMDFIQAQNETIIKLLTESDHGRIGKADEGACGADGRSGKESRNNQPR